MAVRPVEHPRTYQAGEGDLTLHADHAGPIVLKTGNVINPGETISITVLEWNDIPDSLKNATTLTFVENVPAGGAV